MGTYDQLEVCFYIFSNINENPTLQPPSEKYKLNRREGCVQFESNINLTLNIIVLVDQICVILCLCSDVPQLVYSYSRYFFLVGLDKKIEILSHFHYSQRYNQCNYFYWLYQRSQDPVCNFLYLKYNHQIVILQQKEFA